ncbi:TPA: type II toxin-antitoxin system YafO family toxin [Klebsiella pneumoniae]|nr:MULTISPECIES: type II toxin-antitoxin system YafO family toxin [Klebsiella]HDX8901821.1 type II toxin-antitoxin system YafO family toxin [Klebsiella michiganensis]EIX9337709.1 type II toxin-antitoxin system YafO family toxin [Klebsiella pneumoniae]EKA8127180.1 type II toxin-antitoxin system YafO family toxin [Klebsiella pneumoniae]EKJ2552387.1 type II toxin-antitoxin system YafO family toxin [Klebsiella pneumoniae]EKT9770298.1 type II toxin-antitoxin system YafO family toxin [Klebsiella pne
MVRVSITSGLYQQSAAHRYAKMLAQTISNETQYWCFGSHGGFERSYEAMAANIKKIHLKLPGDKPWPPEYSLSQRTCDNYLVYAKHLYNDEHYQIVAIISPNAHDQIDSLLPSIIKLVEDTFSELPQAELDQLKTYNA